MAGIELLAPAKDLSCGLAAIDCGADAVYIGATHFGARENAGNNIGDIAELTEHAHRYWAKVYVTLNTLLRDEEIPQALRLIRQLYETGIDGLIIQDVGLLECDLPPIPLIASTQMHNATPEKVAFLEQVGFQRVILARELSLEQITEIRQHTRVELETFIHGALCVGYSGQCYLSYALGGRSGNRGQCAQPCRKAYTLTDGQNRVLVRNRHLLSLRDLNLTAHLHELIDAGVCSFKIEGRLKDQAYIMNVVSHYRAALDRILEGGMTRKSASGQSVIDFTPDPTKTFNRGFTTHQLHGRRERIGSTETPKMVGELIGTVTAVSPRSFTLGAAAPLHNGDGICFFDANKELRGTVVNGVQGAIVTPLAMDGIAVGARIFRNHDHAFLTRLEKCRPERQIAVALTLHAAQGGVTLAAVDEDGNTAEFTLPCETPLADKPELAQANIDKQLRKMGGTGYACRAVTIDLPAIVFLPVSTLNALRRGALEAMTAAREANRPRSTARLERNQVPYPVRKLDYHGNVLNRLAETFYRRHGVTHIEPAAESGVNLYEQKVMTTKYCLKQQFGYCPKQKPAKLLVDPLTLRDAEGNLLTLSFDCARCEMDVYFGRKRTE